MPLLLTGALALVAVGIHGYHPFAEDGGVYVPGVRYVLDPTLYPEGTRFVTSHLGYSRFAPLVAGLVRSTGVGLEVMLLLLHGASYWLMLGAAWMVAKNCFRRAEERIGAIVLLAVWMSMPVAGTSLMLMDPYVTARSFATPLTVAAIAGMLNVVERRRQRGVSLTSAWMCGLALMLAVGLHPLTAAYGLGCVLVLGCVGAQERWIRVWGTAGLCVLALIAAAGVWAWPGAESRAYREVVATRTYWFLSQWRWFEIIGLVAPLGILAWIAAEQKRFSHGMRSIAAMGATCGSMAVLTALLFAREDGVSHAVARLQPLRIFQMVYLVMILGLGGWAGGRILKRWGWRWAAFVMMLGGVMVLVDRGTYPGSPHLEVPLGVAAGPENGWEAAFLWTRENTPRNAVFALPKDYVAEPGEDAQGFRAIAERSALADFSKDGGEAAITPLLAEAWVREQKAVDGLEKMGDEERVARLRPFGVTWLILPIRARTQLVCPFRNARVQVCRLPAAPS